MESPTDEPDEQYGLSWPGKEDARELALAPAAATLRPCPEESLAWDTTRNLLIEGDNLEALKLLQADYAGAVKLIYIDPPYNTGKDFVYRDDFRDTVRGYQERTGQAPGQATSDTSGRFHAAWLNMLYPRLLAARSLLREDGVIFISIDDNEIGNLRLVCDEVFGEANRIAIICHRARASVSNDRIISSNHNFVLLYARNGAEIFARRSHFGLPPELRGFDRSDERGAFKYVPVDGPGGAAKGNPHYTFLGVTGHFRFSRERMQRMHEEGLVEKVGNGLQQKHYRHDAARSRRTDTTWWDDRLYTASASARLKELMGADCFDGPKPVELIQRMLELWAREPGDVVLDFFAGSGTTGHAVLAQDALDGVGRRFVLVQLPEPLDPARREQAAAAGYCDALGLPRTVAELTKERLRRAARKVAADHPGAACDRGFRVYRLAER